MSHTVAGLWRIEEDEAFFLERLNLYENERVRLSGIKHPQKRLEWLSSRLCLKQLLQISYRVESLNQQNGKPYLSDNSHHISYSHSRKYSAVIASDRRDVAIDIETLDRRRNLETRFLFMNPYELAYFDDHNRDEHIFFLIWSAKETLFKIIGKRGISLRQHIALNLDQLSLVRNGILSGTVLDGEERQSFQVHYELLPEYILTYAQEQVVQPQLQPDYWYDFGEGE
ncbi:MAG: 4'-phosphopantetheinyl transferase superfamily protein [Bacteroidota bacterium]